METQQQQPTEPAANESRQTPFKSSTSPTIFKVAAALARAQGKYKPLIKNCEGKVSYQAKDGRPAGSYTFQYADLGAVIEATSAALASEELAHTAIIGGGIIRVMLLHSSGEWLASEAPLSTGGGPQAFGSQVTYFRRYLLSPLLGVASEDDDDANGAEGNGFDKAEKQQRQPPKGREQQPKDDAAEEIKRQKAACDALVKLLATKNISGKEVLPWISIQLETNIAKLSDLTPEQYTNVKAAAEKLPAKQEQQKGAA